MSGPDLPPISEESLFDKDGGERQSPEAESGPGESLAPRSHTTLLTALTPFLRPCGVASQVLLSCTAAMALSWAVPIRLGQQARSEERSRFPFLGGGRRFLDWRNEIRGPLMSTACQPLSFPVPAPRFSLRRERADEWDSTSCLPSWAEFLFCGERWRHFWLRNPLRKW